MLLSYQSARLVVVQINQAPDITLALSLPGVRELPGNLVTKVHIIPATSPLPVLVEERRICTLYSLLIGATRRALNSHTATL